MFKLLRFEIGGPSALIWMLLLLFPFLNVPRLIQINAVGLFTLVLSSITLSLPLGNYIHQFTDTVFNPFGAYRLFVWPRAVIAELRQELALGAAGYRDTTFQAIIVFAKVHDRAKRTAAEETQFRSSQLSEEISNRYSYYYARLENGFVAPVVGLWLAVLARYVFSGTDYLLREPTFSPVWIFVAGLLFGVVVVWRIPQLFRELDDLEVALVRLQKSCRPDL